MDAPLLRKLYEGARRFGNYRLDIPVQHQSIAVHCCDTNGDGIYRPVQMQAWAAIDRAVKLDPSIWKGVAEIAAVFTRNTIMASSHMKAMMMLIATVQAEDVDGKPSYILWQESKYPTEGQAGWTAPIMFLNAFGVMNEVGLSIPEWMKRSAGANGPPPPTMQKALDKADELAEGASGLPS